MQVEGPPTLPSKFTEITRDVLQEQMPANVTMASPEELAFLKSEEEMLMAEAMHLQDAYNKAEEVSKRQSEELARIKAEQQACPETQELAFLKAEQERKELEVLKQKQVEEKTKREAEELALKAEQERKEQEAKAAEENAKRAAEELAFLKAEQEKKELEAQQKEAKAAEEKAKREAEELALLKAEQERKEALKEQEAKAAEEKAKREAEELAFLKAEQERKELEAQQQEAKAAEEKAKREQVELALLKAEQERLKVLKQQEAKAAEDKAKREAEEVAFLKAEQERRELEAQQKDAKTAEEKAKREGEELALLKAEQERKELEVLKQKEVNAVEGKDPKKIGECMFANAEDIVILQAEIAHMEKELVGKRKAEEYFQLSLGSGHKTLAPKYHEARRERVLLELDIQRKKDEVETLKACQLEKDKIMAKQMQHEENMREREAYIRRLGSEPLFGKRAPEQHVKNTPVAEPAKHGMDCSEGHLGGDHKKMKYTQEDLNKTKEIETRNQEYLEAQKRMKEAEEKHAQMEARREAIQKRIAELETLAPTEPCLSSRCGH